MNRGVESQADENAARRSNLHGPSFLRTVVLHSDPLPPESSVSSRVKITTRSVARKQAAERKVYSASREDDHDNTPFTDLASSSQIELATRQIPIDVLPPARAYQEEELAWVALDACIVGPNGASVKFWPAVILSSQSLVHFKMELLCSSVLTIPWDRVLPYNALPPVPTFCDEYGRIEVKEKLHVKLEAGSRWEDIIVPFIHATKIAAGMASHWCPMSCELVPACAILFLNGFPVRQSPPQYGCNNYKVDVVALGEDRSR